MPILDLANVGYTAYNCIEIAYGGARKVYAAKKGNNNFGCKMLQIEKLGGGCDFRHMLQEVQWLKFLRHQHLVRFYSAIVCDRHLLIATHLSDMGSALTVISKWYPSGLPETALVIIIKQLSQALDYLHSQYILHRSIRASHVLLDSKGGVRLTGFKHCVRLNDPGDGPVQAINSFSEHLSDSLLWLAPEVISQHANGYGLPSDIYSLGITICEMANGFPPFTDMTPLQMLFEKTRGTTPRLLDSTTNVGGEEQTEHSHRRISSGLHRTVAACLSIIPSDRPTSVQLVSNPLFKDSKASTIYKKKHGLLGLLPSAKIISEGLCELTTVEDINETKETATAQLDESIIWDFQVNSDSGLL